MHATIGLVVKEALRSYPYIAFNVLSRCDNTRRRVSTWGVQNENMSPGSTITGLDAGGIVQCVVKLVSAPAESAQCWVTWVWCCQSATGCVKRRGRHGNDDRCAVVNWCSRLADELVTGQRKLLAVISVVVVTVLGVVCGLLLGFMLLSLHEPHLGTTAGQFTLGHI